VGLERRVQEGERVRATPGGWQITETIVTIDAEPLRAAAAHAAELWPDNRPEPPPGSDDSP
jgi:hypothetical protein